MNNGLTLTAARNTNQYAGTYPWFSGVVTTEGKFSLPTTGKWYVQVKAKMPDTSQGMWPAIWFLPAVSGSAFNEIDLHEGGATGGPSISEAGHSNYFDDGGSAIGSFWNAGVDTSAGYHVYGIEFIVGQSCTFYFDGKQVFQVLAGSGHPLHGEPYEIMLELQVAAQRASGWHTVTTGTAPSASMGIAEVQAYT